VVIAEALGGSEEEFARAMTRKARALGMKNTTYRNANGLPNDEQITTARDQALLGIAMNYIGKLIDDNRKKHDDANQAAIDGTNELMSAEDKYYANKRNNEKKAKETVEQAKTSREDVTKSFLTTDPRGREMLFEFAEKQRKLGTNKIGPGYASEDKAMQERVQKLIAEDAKKNPEAGLKPTTAKDFKTPEGFSNVVGVGANPVMEAMNAQLEETQKQTALLEIIASPEGGVPKDFTKNSK
jgi:hypothetical protein